MYFKSTRNLRQNRRSPRKRKQESDHTNHHRPTDTNLNGRY